MSVSKPVMNQMRSSALRRSPKIPRTESVSLPSPQTGMAEAKIPLIISETPVLQDEEDSNRMRKVGVSQAAMMTTATQTAETHPKGHRVKDLDDVWKRMDEQGFVRITDTIVLGDVWWQPVSAAPYKNVYADVKMYQIVVAPHIKYREKVCRMSVDDLLKVLFLADYILNGDKSSVPRSRVDYYDEWVANKTAAFVKDRKNVEDVSSKALLCNYILKEDPTFTLYPATLNNVGIFFRKTCYHSYKSDDMSAVKFENPAIFKCSSNKSSFEYVLEARILPLPEPWFEAIGETVPESQELL